MPRKVIYTDKLMRPIAHFSHASRVGNVVHVGASAGVFPDLRLAGDSPGRVDIEAQTRRMFANLRTTLGLVGAQISDVVHLKAYVADTRDIAKYLDIYAEEFSSTRPAHSVIGSWDFPLPQAAIEIDTIAMIGGHAKVLPDAGLSALSGTDAGGVLADDYHYATAQPIGPSGRVTSYAIKDQALKALRNLGEMLTAASLTPSDVCNVHVTLADMRDLAVVASEFQKFFGLAFPTWTVVGAPLESPDFRITIESTAIKGGGRPIATKLSPHGPGRPAPAILAGDNLFLSGQIVIPEAASGATGVESQARAAWERLHALIDAAGFSQETMLRTNNVLTDWRDFAGFNAGYGPNMAEPYVPRATVLGCLADTRARVQIEGIAHRHGADATIVQVGPPTTR